MSTFSIRPYRWEDVDGIYAAADESRQHVAPWMEWMTDDYSLEDARKWVELAVSSWSAGKAYEHVIVDAVHGSIVGSCGLNQLNSINGFCNLGYWVRSSRLGEGAACQACFLLRKFGFETLGLNRLEIVVAAGNEFSRKVAERSGARYEGILGSRLKLRGIAHDAHLYAFLNPSAKRVDELKHPATSDPEQPQVLRIQPHSKPKVRSD